MGIAATRKLLSEFDERKTSLERSDISEDLVLGSLEVVILMRLSEDQTLSEIADELAYSEITIQTIADLATRKLGCRSLTAAVAKAIRQDLI